MLPFSILVVDDEPDNFDVIEAFLTGEPYCLSYASSGSTAIAALETFEPDVILLDIMMPELDGLMVCQHLKADNRWKNIPIIMVTALRTKEDLAHCLQVGADDFISKPVNRIELKARIQSMVRIKQQYDNISNHYRIQEKTINLLNNTLNELRGNLTSRFSHEINTPLNGILGSLSLLKSTYTDSTPYESYELLEMAYQSACRLEQLTQKFLVYLQIEVSRSYKNTITDPGCSNLPVFITQLCESQAKQWQRLMDLDLSIQCEKGFISHHHLHWLITELMENAFKFSFPSTPVNVNASVCNDRFIFSVHNLGLGMTPEQISMVGAFMQFERAYHPQQGMGMGLKIVQSIVALYGGNLKITSQYRQNITVEVHIPLSKTVIHS